MGYMPLPREQPPRTLYRKPYNQTIMGGPQLTHTETTDAARSMVVTVSCDSRKEGRKEGREGSILENICMKNCALKNIEV